MSKNSAESIIFGYMYFVELQQHAAPKKADLNVLVTRSLIQETDHLRILSFKLKLSLKFTLTFKIAPSHSLYYGRHLENRMSFFYMKILFLFVLTKHVLRVYRRR